MAKKDEVRYIEINVPQEVILETAEIIEINELDAAILGKTEDDLVSIGIDYSINQRESIMEILELIEDFNDEESEEEEEESKED
jgi:hypothetical protein